jgi:hypothetical protein
LFEVVGFGMLKTGAAVVLVRNPMTGATGELENTGDLLAYGDLESAAELGADDWLALHKKKA